MAGAGPVEIWINPACSKCRSAKEHLDAAGIEYVERRYLDEPPTAEELAGVLDRLALEPWDLARPRETCTRHNGSVGITRLGRLNPPIVRGLYTSQAS